MPPEITSKFSVVFWLMQFFFLACVVALITWVAFDPFKKPDTIDESHPFLRAVLIGLILAKYVHQLYHSFKEITVTPDYIKVTYLLSGKERNVIYEEITEINSLRNRSDGLNSFSFSISSIQLEDGGEISYAETEFKNFTDLKDAVWEYKHINR